MTTPAAGSGSGSSETTDKLMQYGGGALSLAGMAYAAIKGGQANRRNTRLLNEYDAGNEAWYNNNRNYFDTVQGKSALEQVREAYEERAKRDANTAVVTGATPEAEIAMKAEANKGYNQSIRQLAQMGGDYSARNEGIYRAGLRDILQQRIGQNNLVAQSAANLSANVAGLYEDAASATKLAATGGI